jgi:hypothetical protein
MGEVYRARDTRLGRDVALKILPNRFAHDADRLSRFKREAQVLASLNHTNIAVLYDVEELDGVQALVMEFVDGDTVADRLARGALSTRDVVAVGMQIVDGLEAAHERGVIHRDLKPSNIAVRDDGVVKILDFGLAKALDASSLSTTSSDRTMTSPATQVGVVVGTPAYMSPEQVEGRAADTRSDIWAFGCVLYEMLVGKPAFAGETTTETLSAVMTREPDWGALPVGTPAPLVKLVRWCLEKHRKRRLAHIADARAEMTEALAPGGSAPLLHPARRRREVFAWAIAALSLAALAIGAAYVVAARQTPAMVRFTVLVPQASARDPGIALSPDGKSLVYVAPGPTKEDVLWIRLLDELEGKPLAGTEGAWSPFWSPDSRSVGFFTQSRLKRVPAAGGTVQTLVDGLRPQIGGVGGAWNANDVIVFAQVFGPLQAVPAAGGSPRPVTRILEERKEFGHYNPVFLPDGEHLVYDVGVSLLEHSGVYSSSLTSTDKTRIMSRSVVPFVVTTNGFLLFVDDGLLKAQRFDLQRRQLAGSSFPIAGAIDAVSASTNGTLAYRQAIAARTQLTWVDRKGTVLGTVGRPNRYEVLALSPDETRAAFARDGDIWVLDLAREIENRLTADPGFDGFPTWSANGNDILYSHGVVGGGAMGGTLLRKPASGAGTEEVLLQQRLLFPVETSADGRFLTYAAPGPTESLDLHVLPLAGGNPVVFLDSRFQEMSNRLSPDGKWMAYVSDETGQQEVYVQTFPRSDKRWKISDGGGLQPIWRRDGRELFFLGRDGTLMAVDVKTTPAFEPGTPQRLFSAELDMRVGSRVAYAPARDGQRFLVNARVDGGGSPIVVVLNWSRDLSQP